MIQRSWDGVRSFRTRRIAARCALALSVGFVGWLAACSSSDDPPPDMEPPAPNILFIILDDVGIDQLTIFNPDAPNPVSTPNLDAIINAGVRFTNCWTMPECSPSRSGVFTGRYPMRTGVDAAILAYDLPAAQVSPYEVTTPEVLATAGYESALVGKFHLGGPDLNPDGYATPAALGWDYYLGNLQGGPPFIDPTLGGQTTDSSLYPCGFPIGDGKGSCWFEDANGDAVLDDNGGAGYTGQECVVMGGIPALCANGHFGLDCGPHGGPADPPDFSDYNGYYSWPQVINDAGQVLQSNRREYMTVAQTDAAIDWIQGRSATTPWMCTVSYDSIHTPYQQPPPDLYPPGFSWPVRTSDGMMVTEGCETSEQQSVLGDLMLYAMDLEIGRLMVSIGLATTGPSGELIYDPNAHNTMVVVLGDNGTFVTSVRLPYDPLRSKATPYQTGVLAPLVVAGPLVTDPGRAVDHLTNCVDLFDLFGEIAGVDVESVVPASHTLDAQPLMPYLTSPFQAPIRQYNFTQLGDGVICPSETTWPCVLTVAGVKVCNDILFNTESLCNDTGGEWFGPGAPVVYQSCCEVRANHYPNLTIVPSMTWAVRNVRYKLVKSQPAVCDQVDGNEFSFEFYDLMPTGTNPEGLDLSTNDLLASRTPLTPEQQSNLDELMQVLQAQLDSEYACYGDGNLDKVVDQLDLDGVMEFQGQPSTFDFNNDGTTDQADIDCVMLNFGHVCAPGDPGTPCPD